MRLEYFQLIDRIVALDLDARTVKAQAKIPPTSTIFEGHFPGHPLMPGVLLIETMAQTSGWLIIGLTKFERMAFLASVREAKLRAFVSPGQDLTKARNFASLTEARKAIRSNLVRPIISHPDVCAMVSIRSTPGISGWPGKCPSKIVLVGGIFACALTVRASRSSATIRSINWKYSSRMPMRTIKPPLRRPSRRSGRTGCQARSIARWWLCRR